MKNKNFRSADVLVSNEGSVFRFTLCSQTARDWFAENVQSEGWQWLGSCLVVDHRYAWDLANGCQEAGLEVR